MQFAQQGPLSPLMAGHLVNKFAEQGKRTIVFGHRGGFLGPENTMKGFEAAINHKIEAIEFDVWLSKDEVPMVLHGGDDGELVHYDLPEERVFYWTRERLQREIDTGDGERMPTLEQVLELCQGSPNMILNIELKGPWNAAWEPHYDYRLAAQKVVELIYKYDIGYKVIVSSFSPRIIDEVIAVTTGEGARPRNFMIQSLHDIDQVPDKSFYGRSGKTAGINIDYSNLTEGIVNEVRREGKYLGIWYYKQRDNEDQQMWETVFTRGGGVDFFYSDFPLEAMLARDQAQKSIIRK